MAITADFQLHSYGLNDWLLTLTDATQGSLLSQLQASLCNSPLITETVVGYDSLLIRAKAPLSCSLLKDILESSWPTQTSNGTHTRHHDIHVHYNGPDLYEVAAVSGITPKQVIQLHTEPLYSVRFLGFSPGFAYLDGLAPQLQLPRRSTPRPTMDAGAVAIGGTHTGIYTTPSPGGWNWLGNTNHPLFDKFGHDSSAFTLHPGDTLRFISTD